jgi:pimeloyl-ACP methyl ester carboxylesterase
VDGEGDRVALLQHGFPDGPHGFRHQVAPLTARGYRVVRPFLRGYAPSSLADGRYGVERLAGDLLALTDHFSPRAPIVLVGHDWGAIAAYAACARAPERISHLCTAAVPHLRVAARRFLRPRQLRRSAYIGLFQFRGVAERLVARDDFRMIDRLWRAWSPGYRASAGELAIVKEAFRDPAHLRAALGFYRALRPARSLFRKTRVASLYLHGVDDGCVGVELADDVERAYAGPIRVVRMRGAGHFLQLEQPDAFNRELIAFLEQGQMASHSSQKVHER